MRYIFLIYQDEDRLSDGTNPITEHRAFNAETRRAGVYVAGESLQPTLTATTVRLYNGKPRLSDGPAVETTFSLSGYYVLDVADERDALRWAAKIPAARIGVVEIRRVVSAQASASN